MAEETKEVKSEGKIAVILIRGMVDVTQTVKDGLSKLKLRKVFVCAVLDKNPSTQGMVVKCKDYVTWGEIDAATEKELTEKRGKESKGTIKHFHLHPPRKGFERKGIKVPFRAGGALGYRGTKINDLIKRML